MPMYWVGNSGRYGEAKARIIFPRLLLSLPHEVAAVCSQTPELEGSMRIRDGSISDDRAEWNCFSLAIFPAFSRVKYKRDIVIVYRDY